MGLKASKSEDEGFKGPKVRTKALKGENEGGFEGFEGEDEGRQGFEGKGDNPPNPPAPVKQQTPFFNPTKPIRLELGSTQPQPQIRVGSG